MSSTRVSRHVKASRASVYRALIDAEAVARWKVPTEMTCQVHTFEGREGLVVEVDEFETADPALRGEMTITIMLADADGGTDLVAVHDGLPRGVSTADNEVGWREALTRLAALVEAVPA